MNDASRRRVSVGRSARVSCRDETGGGEPPDLGCGTARRHRNFDAADAHAHESADLEQLETNGAAGGFGELRVMKSDAAQGAEQHVGHRGEPQAQLICSHRGGRCAIGIEIELTLLDPVLHVAAGAVDFLIEISGFALGTRERGYHKARIGFSSSPFGLGHHAPPPAPAAARRPPEVLEAPRRLASTLALRRSPIKLVLDQGDEPVVLGQSEEEVDAIRLAPGHQFLAREAAVGTQQNARPRPALAGSG